MLGVDAIIIGSITQFGRDDKKTDVAGGGGLSDRLRRSTGIGGFERKQSTAVVQITARMIDTTTAEILASVQGHGEESRSGTGILGAGGSYGGMAAGALDMRSSNFANTILGAAVNKAVTDVAHGLDQKAASMPTKTVQIDALVADVAPDGTMVINVGAKGGVKVGDRLEVKRRGRPIRDPETGKILRQQEDLLGSLLITDVDANSAGGKFTGSGQPKVGDAVTSPK